MKKKRMVHAEGLPRILFTLAVLFLCISDSRRHSTPNNRNEIISQETIQHHSTVAGPVVCTSPPTIPVTTDGTDISVTDSEDTLNVTAGASNTTDLPDSIGTETAPSDPECLQGWAIFLICLGAVVTVFLLAGIPAMNFATLRRAQLLHQNYVSQVYCILQSQQLPPQTCPLHYNCKIYTAPEEQGFQLE